MGQCAFAASAHYSVLSIREGFSENRKVGQFFQRQRFLEQPKLNERPDLIVDTFPAELSHDFTAVAMAGDEVMFAQ